MARSLARAPPLVQMENLLHLCPPFTLFSCRQRFLQRLHDGPPLLSLGVGGHPLPVCLRIIAVVFEIAEKKTIFEVDRVVPDIAIRELLQYLWPYLSVICPVVPFASLLKP